MFAWKGCCAQSSNVWFEKYQIWYRQTSKYYWGWWDRNVFLTAEYIFVREKVRENVASDIFIKTSNYVSKNGDKQEKSSEI